MDINIRLLEVNKDGTMKFIEYAPEKSILESEVIHNIINNNPFWEKDGIKNVSTKVEYDTERKKIRDITKHINDFRNKNYACKNFEVKENGICIWEEKYYRSIDELALEKEAEDCLDENIKTFIDSFLAMLGDLHKEQKVAKLGGEIPVRIYKTLCGHHIYKVVNPDNTCMVVVPSDVEGTKLALSEDGLFVKGFDVYDSVKVIGGGIKLRNLNNLFKYVKTKKIDIDQLELCNVDMAVCMFYGIETERIDTWWTQKCVLKNASSMFASSRCNVIDLRNFKSGQITKMNSMFHFIKATEIIGIEDLNVSSLRTARTMFISYSNEKGLDLQKWDTAKLKHASKMFYNCEVPFINIRGWNTKSLETTDKMFDYFEGKIMLTHSRDKINYAVQNANM